MGTGVAVGVVLWTTRIDGHQSSESTTQGELDTVSRG